MKRINGKKIMKVAGAFLVAVMLACTISCGSTAEPGDNTEEVKAPDVKQNEEKPAEKTTENKSDSEDEVIQEKAEDVVVEPEKICRFSNWKYFGFGTDLPLWVDGAFDNDIEAIMNAVPDLAGKKILIESLDSETLDQAESTMSKRVDMDVIIDDEAFTLYERFWVQIKDEYIREENCPYCSLAILVSIEDVEYEEE